jgi:hypothetical protein
MRWEVKYPEPKKPIPFDNWDMIVCLGFAYSYTICVMSFNIVLFIITELLWAWFIKERVKR